jgi:hypothetical protein
MPVLVLRVRPAGHLGGSGTREGGCHGLVHAQSQCGCDELPRQVTQQLAVRLWAHLYRKAAASFCATVCCCSGCSTYAASLALW